MKLNKCKCGGDALIFFEKVSVKKYGVCKLYFVECLKCAATSDKSICVESAIKSWNEANLERKRKS